MPTGLLEVKPLHNARMLTVSWDDQTCEVLLIDQRLLPGRLEVARCRDAVETAYAIREMVVRGAPAIGVTAAYGLAAQACRSTAKNMDGLRVELSSAANLLRQARPTAVNLAWGIERMMRTAGAPAGTIDELRQCLVAEAEQIAREDVQTNQKMAALGAELIEDGDTIIHHCNTGALAAVDWGTALGVIRMAHEQGKRIHVLVDETRPRLQGARLTAWELTQYGISFELISDNMAGYFLKSGQAQKVFFGADRVAANGDVANKIGTYMLALAAHTNDVPVYSVAPSTTVDLNIAHGDLIPIEERDPQEVLNIQINGERIVPDGAKARNPAFDVTPHTLLTAIITEKGVVYPPFVFHLPRILRGS